VLHPFVRTSRPPPSEQTSAVELFVCQTVSFRDFLCAVSIEILEYRRTAIVRSTLTAHSIRHCTMLVRLPRRMQQLLLRSTATSTVDHIVSRLADVRQNDFCRTEACSQEADCAWTSSHPGQARPLNQAGGSLSRKEAPTSISLCLALTHAAHTAPQNDLPYNCFTRGPFLSLTPPR